MDANDHVMGLGRLMGYLQSLEATIRIFLTWTGSENYMISRDTFGQLIEKYNKQLASDEPYSIDQQVVDIRNALAHGLVFAPSNTSPLILNMSLPLTLTKSLPLTLFHAASGLNVQMTVDWFQGQQTLVQDQINRIVDCAKKRGIS